MNNEQRNLISLFFELPNKNIKVGDTWGLDVHLISLDQHFKCDTSFRKDQVKLIEIKNQKKDTIAVIKYDITEYVSGFINMPSFFGGGNKSTKTISKITYDAIAEFSLGKGRWINYYGIMSISTTGLLNINTKKKFALITQ